MALVDLTLVKAHLGSTATGVPMPTGSDDALLQQLISSASKRIQAADLAGPVEETDPIVERHDGDDEVIHLFRTPVLQVVSVVEHRLGASSATLTESTPEAPTNGYTLEQNSGELVRVQNNYPISWWPGWRNVVITYTAGRDGIPDEVIWATLELVAHWWRLRKGGTPTYSPAGDTGFNAGGGMGYGIPNRVRDILGADYLRPPVIG